MAGHVVMTDADYAYVRPDVVGDPSLWIQPAKVHDLSLENGTAVLYLAGMSGRGSWISPRLKLIESAEEFGPNLWRPGTVNNVKGHYCFIHPDAGPPNVMCMPSANAHGYIARANDRVKFRAGPSEKAGQHYLQAIHVMPLVAYAEAAAASQSRPSTMHQDEDSWGDAYEETGVDAEWDENWDDDWDEDESREDAQEDDSYDCDCGTVPCVCVDMASELSPELHRQQSEAIDGRRSVAPRGSVAVLLDRRFAVPKSYAVFKRLGTATPSMEESGNAADAVTQPMPVRKVAAPKRSADIKRRRTGITQPRRESDDGEDAERQSMPLRRVGAPRSYQAQPIHDLERPMHESEYDEPPAMQNLVVYGAREGEWASRSEWLDWYSR